MSKDVHAVIHFMDGTKMTFGWPRQSGDTTAMLTRVRKALEMDKLAVEVQGDLFVILIRNVKYVQLTPAPAKLPAEVIKGGEVVGLVS
jgi:hypothetical protein